MAEITTAKCLICNKIVSGEGTPKELLYKHVKAVHAPKDTLDMFRGKPKERKKYLGYNYKD